MLLDKIFIKNLLVRGILGIHDWEREKVQDILINIEIEGNFSKAAQEDKIEHTTDYRKLTKNIIAHTESAQRLTVEALAEDIAKICLDDSHVKKTKVRVEKPGAVRFAESVGVEIERSR